MLDRDYANHVLAADAEFQRLRSRFNALGITRFFVYVAAIILAIVAGINSAWGILIGGLVVSFVIVMILEYNRTATRARQQARAIQLGLITPEDLR